MLNNNVTVLKGKINNPEKRRHIRLGKGIWKCGNLIYTYIGDPYRNENSKYVSVKLEDFNFDEQRAIKFIANYRKRNLHILKVKRDGSTKTEYEHIYKCFSTATGNLIGYTFKINKNNIKCCVYASIKKEGSSTLALTKVLTKRKELLGF